MIDYLLTIDTANSEEFIFSPPRFCPGGQLGFWKVFQYNSQRQSAHLQTTQANSQAKVCKRAVSPTHLFII